MKGVVVPAERGRRVAAAQVGNVVPLHVPKETAEDIVRDVRARRLRQEEAVSAKLEELISALDQRHRKRAQELMPIGYAMDAPTLRDFIEIGRRMLGQKGARR